MTYIQKTGVLIPTMSQFPSSVKNFTAKPRTSRTESLVPLSPPTVEKRIKTGVWVPGFWRNLAQVRWEISAVTSTIWLMISLTSSTCLKIKTYRNIRELLHLWHGLHAQGYVHDQSEWACQANESLAVKWDQIRLQSMSFGHQQRDYLKIIIRYEFMVKI